MRGHEKQDAKRNLAQMGPVQANQGRIDNHIDGMSQSVPTFNPLAASTGRLVDPSLIAARAAESAPSRSGAKAMSEPVWNGRVGNDEFAEIFQSAAQGAKRAAQSRQLQARAQRLGMFEPADLGNKAREVWGASGEKKLDASARNAAFQLSVGGATALKRVLQHMDPLERLLVLSKVSEYLGPGDTQAHNDLEMAVLQLKEHHDDEIIALKNSAAAFANLRETGPEENPSADSATGLRSVYLDAGRMPGDTVISPQKLARSLMEKCDESKFEAALDQLGAGVLADLRSPQPSRHALRVGVALTNAGALMTVRTAMGIAKDLRGRLASNGKDLEKSNPEIVCAMLDESAGGCSSSNALCNSLFGEGAASRALGSPSALTSVRQAVQATPDSWWPSDNKGSKLKLLDDIDSRISALGEYGKNPSVEVASRLRAKLPKPVSPEGKTP